jgi:branched-chain amino acid transport system substrate-binding protein
MIGAFGVAAGSAVADVKIAFIDPLSGGGAATGILAQKTHQFYIDAINASGGINGEKIQLLSYDNKVNPQESLVAAQKAIDAGIRIITQGNGSSVAAALLDFVQKYNDRNPGKEIVYLNYAAVDPVLTNEKCSYWHFRFDAHADMRMAALMEGKALLGAGEPARARPLLTHALELSKELYDDDSAHIAPVQTALAACGKAAR